MTLKLGFIGLGAMGLPMLQNLARADDTLIYAYDLSDTPFRTLADDAAWGKRLFRANTIADLAACNTVILMLPNSAAVDAALFGTNGGSGLADHLSTGSRVIDMGSSDPIETQRVAKALAEREIDLVDAPVSGGVAKARSGTLSIMVGARDVVLDDVRSLLSRMGTDVIACGEIGSAHAMKALNNYVYAAGLRAVIEATLIAEKTGLDTTIFAQVLNASSGRNVASETKLTQFILPGDYSGGFLLRLQAKDLAIADRLREQSHVAADQLAACCSLWAEASEAMPTADNTALHAFLREASGSPSHTRTDLISSQKD